MSKVFMVGGGYMGCNYVRLLLPLIENGWKWNYQGLNKVLKPVAICQREMMDSDIVVFHRADTIQHHKTAIALKQMGKKIVFDNDDTYQLDENHPFFGLDERGFEQNKEMMNNITNNFIRNADLVTCSTEYLAKEYRELNPNVVVLKNCVNPDDWSEPKRNKGKKVRIGIVGSTAYHHDFQTIEKLLTKLDNDDRVQLVVLGLTKHNAENPKVAEVYKREFSFWESLKNLEFHPWVQTVEYFDALNDLELDIMIIPRRENHFNKAKSNVKFLEAAMLEIPVIAQSFPNAPYENDIDGTNGILVKTEKDWEIAVESLIVDKKKRRAMGKKAHKYVLDNYQIKDNAHLWAEAYEKLLSE